jgi:hypothetical protein
MRLAAVCVALAVASAALAASGCGGPRAGDRGARLYFTVTEGHRGAYRQYLATVSLDAPRSVARLTRVDWPAELSGVAVADGKVFWTSGSERNRLIAARPDGTARRTLVTGISSLSHLVAAAGHLYWLGEDAIGRVDPDGQHLTRRFVVPSQEDGGGIGLDLATDGRYLYFTRCTDEAIARVGIDGRGLDERYLRLPPGTCPFGLAYARGHLYWTWGGIGTPGYIGRATLKTKRIELGWLHLGYHGATSVAVGGADVFWDWGGGGGSPTFIGRATTGGKIVTLRFAAGTGPLYMSP